MHDWTIFSVFDPERNGADFAYTSGLWPRHPEVFVWARPVDGDDPGADWMLSPNDRGHLLNSVAADCLSGARAIGDSWCEVYDGGFTTVRYTLEPAVPAGGTEAHQLDAETPVTVLRFALIRPPVEDRPAGERQARLARRFAEHLDAAEDERVRIFGDEDPIPGAPLDGAGVWAEAVAALQRAILKPDLLGPLTGAIVVRAEIDAALGVIFAAARHAGRTEELEAVLDAAHIDALGLADTDEDARTDPLWRTALEAHLRSVLASAYGTMVVADLIDASWRARGCGWVACLADPVGASRRFHARTRRVDRAAYRRALARWGRAHKDAVEAAQVRAATAGCGADFTMEKERAAASLAVVGHPPEL